MRDSLPKSGPLYNETAIVNLDSKNNIGSHWVCYKKRGKLVHYFDSFGNLRPPSEIINYFGKDVKIKYNYRRYQKFNSFNCGHLCLEFLLNNKI